MLLLHKRIQSIFIKRSTIVYNFKSAFSSLLLVNSYILDAHNSAGGVCGVERGGRCSWWWWCSWSSAGWSSASSSCVSTIDTILESTWPEVDLKSTWNRLPLQNRPILKTIKSTSSRIQVKSSRIGGLKSLPGLPTNHVFASLFIAYLRQLPALRLMHLRSSTVGWQVAKPEGSALLTLMT